MLSLSRKQKRKSRTLTDTALSSPFGCIIGLWTVSDLIQRLSDIVQEVIDILREAIREAQEEKGDNEDAESSDLAEEEDEDLGAFTFSSPDLDLAVRLVFFSFLPLASV